MRRSRHTSRLLTVRARVLSMVLLVSVVGLALAGTLTFTVQLASLTERVNAELEQEVEELRLIGERGPSGDGAPFTNLEELFFTYLQSSASGTYEASMTLIDGEVRYVSGGDQPFELNQSLVLELIEEELDPGERIVRELDTGGEVLRILATSVDLVGDTRDGVFVVGIDIGTQRARVWDEVRTYTLVALGTTLLAGLVTYLLTGRLLRPLTELREATTMVDLDDLTRRVEVSSADTDVAELAVNFNQMLDRLAAGFADQRQFLDDAAHELRTPLTIVRGNLEVVDRQDPEDVAQTVDLVLDETERMQRLVDDLLLLAKSQRPDFVRPDLVDLAEFGEELMDRVKVLGDRHWVRATSATGVIVADRHRLVQAVVQLAANAVKFSEDGDTVTIGTTWALPDRAAVARGAAPSRGHHLVIWVQDTGIGISAEAQERIFDRFSRAEEVSAVEGSGLGLPIVLAIARAHQGTVTLESRPGVGSTFRVWIPGKETSGP